MSDRLKIWLSELQKYHNDNHIAEVICEKEKDFEIPDWIGYVITGNFVCPFDKDEYKK